MCNEKKVVSKVIDLTMNVAAFITNLSLRLVTIKKVPNRRIKFFTSNQILFLFWLLYKYY